MVSTRRCFYLIVATSLAACSTGPAAVTTVQSQAPEVPAADSGDVVFPPTWTPTSKPTQAPATATTAFTLQPISGTGADLNYEVGVATPFSRTVQTSSWQIVEGATASFKLPASFEVLDLGSEFGMLMAALMTGMIEGMAELANEIGAGLGATPAPPTPFDTSELETTFNIDFVLAMMADQQTSAFLFSEPLEESSSLEDQIQSTLEEQDEIVEILSIDRVTGSSLEKARLHLASIDNETGEPGQILLYLILRTDRVYQLGYAAASDQFSEMLPLFETSAATFELKTP